MLYDTSLGSIISPAPGYKRAPEEFEQIRLLARNTTWMPVYGYPVFLVLPLRYHALDIRSLCPHMDWITQITIHTGSSSVDKC